MNLSLKFVFQIALISFIGLTSIGCNSVSSLYHTYMMRGSVVDVVNRRQVVLCIGSEDGAKPGQVLRVFRTIHIENGAGEHYTYGRVDVGKVRIESIIDEHYARAEVLNGELIKYDHVELIDDP